jgi:hypothetical protein
MEMIFNWITDKLLYIINIIMSILPDSPFVMLAKDGDIQNVLGYVNWFFPVTEMIAILETWLIAISVFYAYQIILRWAKAIE